jgi:secondary thiamine-phosphate synthase enzyme
MLYDCSLSTPKQDFYNITPQVRESVAKSGVASGIAVVYCPHTTAGITINENADPDVVHDLLIGLSKAFPACPEFRHGDFLRSAFGSIIPAWHMNKSHWITVIMGGDAPDDLTKTLIGQSYDLISPRLRKKGRAKHEQGV